MIGEGGFVLVQRGIYFDPVFRSPREAGLFAWMVGAAQWRPATIGTRWGPIALDVGEILIAERELAEGWALHRNTVRTLIQRLADRGGHHDLSGPLPAPFRDHMQDRKLPAKPYT